MFKQFLLIAAIASLTLGGSSQACCDDDFGRSVASPSAQPRPDVTRFSEGLLDEIVSWLASNFDLHAIRDRPAIQFASKVKLATMHADDSAHWQGLTQADGIDQSTQRQVVALYDSKSKTILISDDWIGKTPAEQSVLVHEIMVHSHPKSSQTPVRMPHGEKLAYLAQDKWLRQFGTSLEKEFDVDMFTVLISSACAY